MLSLPQIIVLVLPFFVFGVILGAAWVHFEVWPRVLVWLAEYIARKGVR